MFEVSTPSRLHFGLLAHGRDAVRQFGGVGLMVAGPRTVLHARPRDDGRVEGQGRMSDRAIAFAQTALARSGSPLGLSLLVRRVPRPHTGLGSGTQLAMCVARVVAELTGEPVDAHALAAKVQRGKRSAIGAHGFVHGGFLVDAGKTGGAGGESGEGGGELADGGLSPLAVRCDFPDDWPIVLIRPIALTGLSGAAEQRAFDEQVTIPSAVTDALCRLVVMGMLPALAQRDLRAFGEALYEVQQRVGACFAASQGGVYAHPMLGEMVAAVRGMGVAGVGQSSWGPTLYALCGDADQARELTHALQRRFRLESGELLITYADNTGASLRRIATLQP